MSDWREETRRAAHESSSPFTRLALVMAADMAEAESDPIETWRQHLGEWLEEMGLEVVTASADDVRPTVAEVVDALSFAAVAMTARAGEPATAADERPARCIYGCQNPVTCRFVHLGCKHCEQARQRHDESRCDRCHGSNPVWWVDHDLWNATGRTDGADEFPFLCPSCFVALAEERGVVAENVVWKLVPDDRLAADARTTALTELQIAARNWRHCHDSDCSDQILTTKQCNCGVWAVHDAIAALDTGAVEG